MSVKIQLEQFEGPYDLLLKLIKKEELDITKVALSEVTEQYLDYIDKIEEEKTDELSDFLVVATKLLLLKSSHFIPDESEEVDEQKLQQQLKVYKRFKKASENIKELWGENVSYTRKQDLSKYKQDYKPDNLTTAKLNDFMVRLIEELEPTEPPIETKVDTTISVKEKINQIRSLLTGKGNVSLKDSVSEDDNKSELIASFLALLELVKQFDFQFSQRGAFGSINISKAE
ncbi:MAG: ScpA family protein [Candidatus Magasanikbacteria bacterium]